MRYAWLGLLVIGCGGDPDPPVCNGSPTGLYRSTWTVQGGDCPPLPESVVDLTEGTPNLGDCVVVHAEHAWCTLEAVVRCPSKRTPLEESNCRQYGCAQQPSVTMSEHVEWRPDFRSASGTVGFDVAGHVPPAENCHGVYGLTLTKL